MSRILGVLAALLLVAGPLGTGSATADDVDPAMAGAPIVGTCYDPTMKETGGQSVPREAVDCTTTHTTEVIAVGTLPARLTWNSARGDIDAAVGDVCSPTMDRITGSNPLRQVRAQYSWVWFQPTAEEAVAGARWFSCHAMIFEDSRLAPLPHPLPKLGKKIDDSVASCLTSRREYTTCADQHAWRASYSFYATGKLTTKNLDRAAARTCPRHVTSRAWLRDAWDVRGKRFIVACYSKTKR